MDSAQNEKKMGMYLDAYLVISSLLEIPASRVFLGADAKLLGTNLEGARMPLSVCVQSLLELNTRS